MPSAPPPPLPSSRTPETGSITRQAAAASLLIPVALVALVSAAQRVIAHSPTEVQGITHIVVGAVLVFLGIVGAVLGGIALFGGEGSRRVPAILGILLNVAVLGLFASGVVRGIQESRANLNRLASMRKEIQREVAQQSRNL